MPPATPSTPLGRFFARTFLTLFMAPFFAGGWFFAFAADKPQGAFGVVFTVFGLAFMGLAIFVVGAAWLGNFARPVTPATPAAPDSSNPFAPAPKPGVCAYCGRPRANPAAPCQSCGAA